MQNEDFNNSRKRRVKLGAPYKILAIETSFDETAVSVLEYTDLYNHKILSEELSSQVKIHAEYGGVVPEIASREHLNNLKKILKIALEKANLTLEEIDLISATRGPGLKGCLLIGYNFAKGLAIARKAINKEIPFIGVNHIEGHVFSTFLEPENKALKFPFISLVVSGAHTELHIIHDFDKYELFSKTIDDAAGEAFDKSANLLGFSYPGGAKLSNFAKGGEASKFKLPKVMRERKEFSFSGLKTAISLLIQRNSIETKINQENEDPQTILTRRELCFTIEEAIVDTLIDKLKLVITETGIKQVSVTGGVSANWILKKKLQELGTSKNKADQAFQGVECFFPSKFHATDNATMIALVAGMRFERGETTELDIDVVARWGIWENEQRSTV